MKIQKTQHTKLVQNGKIHKNYRTETHKQLSNILHLKQNSHKIDDNLEKKPLVSSRTDKLQSLVDLFEEKMQKQIQKQELQDLIKESQLSFQEQLDLCKIKIYSPQIQQKLIENNIKYEINTTDQKKINESEEEQEEGQQQQQQDQNNSEEEKQLQKSYYLNQKKQQKNSNKMLFSSSLNRITDIDTSLGTRQDQNSSMQNLNFSSFQFQEKQKSQTQLIMKTLNNENGNNNINNLNSQQFLPTITTNNSQINTQADLNSKNAHILTNHSNSKANINLPLNKSSINLRSNSGYKALTEQSLEGCDTYDENRKTQNFPSMTSLKSMRVNQKSRRNYSKEKFETLKQQIDIQKQNLLQKQEKIRKKAEINNEYHKRSIFTSTQNEQFGKFFPMDLKVQNIEPVQNSGKFDALFQKNYKEQSINQQIGNKGHIQQHATQQGFLSDTQETRLQKMVKETQDKRDSSVKVHQNYAQNIEHRNSKIVSYVGSLGDLKGRQVFEKNVEHKPVFKVNQSVNLSNKNIENKEKVEYYNKWYMPVNLHSVPKTSQESLDKINNPYKNDNSYLYKQLRETKDQYANIPFKDQNQEYLAYKDKLEEQQKKIEGLKNKFRTVKQLQSYKNDIQKEKKRMPVFLYEIYKQ